MPDFIYQMAAFFKARGIQEFPEEGNRGHNPFSREKGYVPDLPPQGAA
jgi:hypothetical protein